MKFLILIVFLISSVTFADGTCQKLKSKSQLQRYSSIQFQKDGPKDTQALSWAIYSRLNLKLRLHLLDDLEKILSRPECISAQDSLIIHDLERLYGVDEQSLDPTRLHSVVMALSGDEDGIQLDEVYNFIKKTDDLHHRPYVPLADLRQRGYPGMMDKNSKDGLSQYCGCLRMTPSESGMVCAGPVECPSQY